MRIGTTTANVANISAPQVAAQELFSVLATHLLHQAAKSRRAWSRRCALRGAHNRKCPVGALIPDELYHPELETCSVGELLDQGVLAAAFAPHAGLIQIFQQPHDPRPPHLWPRE